MRLINLLLLLLLISCNKNPQIKKLSYDDQRSSTLIDNDYISLYRDLDDILFDSLLDGSPGEHSICLSFKDSTFFNKETGIKRFFTYFIPNNLSDNYSILFNFHGNSPVESTGIGPTQLMNISIDLKNICDTSNIVIISPQGSVSSNGLELIYGWNIENKDQLYFDILANKLRESIYISLGVNLNVKSIHVTGQSSGALFSWLLAYYRSEVIASSIPRFGQIRATPEMINNPPKVKVPISVILGKEDLTVQYNSAVRNARIWADSVIDINGKEILDTSLYTISAVRKDTVFTIKIIDNTNPDYRVEINTLNNSGHGGGFSLYKEFVIPFLKSNIKK